MSIKLEIFKDLAVYTSETTITDAQSTNLDINIPLEVSHIVSLARGKKGIINVYAQQVSSGELVAGNEIYVMDKYNNTITGTLIHRESEDQGICIVSDGQTTHFVHPAVIHSVAGGQLFRVLFNKGSYQTIILRGINTNIKWDAVYTLFTEDGDIFTVLNLSANVYNTGEPLNVNRLEVSMRNYNSNTFKDHKEISYMQQLSPEMDETISSPSVVPESPTASLRATENIRNPDTYMTYGMDLNYKLYKQNNIPLWSVVLNVSKQYYFFIGDNKIYYGIELNDVKNMFFPNGIVSVINSNLNGVTRFHTEGSVNRKVRFLIDESNDISVVPSVQVSSQHIVEYNLIIDSSKTAPISLHIIQKVRDYKRIISEQKYSEDRVQGEIRWTVTVNPGTNEIKGAYTIGY